MIAISIDNIFLFLGALLIFFSILFSKPKLTERFAIAKSIITSTSILGVGLCLLSFFILFPFTKSKNFQNNKLISGNYLDRLRDESKLQAVTKELIKNKFDRKDTLFFKGIYDKDKSFFAVLTIHNVFVNDSIISFTYSATYTSSANIISYDKNYGSINLSTNAINFGGNQIGKVEVNDFGKLQIIPFLKKDYLEYVEF